jgi:cyclase
LILLDIAATPNNRGPRFDLIKEVCSNLFCPVTIGGGVRTLDDIRQLLLCGADKVSIHAEAYKRPEFIREASDKFGAQAVTVSVDARSIPDAVREADNFYRLGAGEILLNCVERDGTMQGFDLELIERVSSAVGIPVVACGGCGSYEHFEQALNAGAHAVASGAMFQFCDATPKGAAKHLHEKGFSVRV